MKKAIIIGAGPAGLTAAYELLKKTGIIPVVIEADTQVGGLAKTVNYKGNRIDIGGHRFFSKSENIIQWWLNFLPLDHSVTDNHLHIAYQHKSADFEINKTGIGNDTMLLRPRKSRIFYRRKFFDYPLQLNFSTFRKLGFIKVIRISCSYLRAKLFPKRPEKSLEQFFINRFGEELYKTFFKDYTEKVWGVPCKMIPAGWGRQRVKDLNISKLVWHSFKSFFGKNKSLSQQGTSTSLIEQFLYPKFGPGQLWENVANKITAMGGEIHLNTSVVSLHGNNNELKSATLKNHLTGEQQVMEGDYFLSSMPIKELINSFNGIHVPATIKDLTEGLEYRDFLIVGILTSQLAVSEDGKGIKDNWIYIQDKNVKAGRVQVFNNWSSFMVNDPLDIWLGIEYFCNETDDFWKQTDDQIIAFAANEIQKIGILNSNSLKDAVVVRVKKAYPSYHGSYSEFPQVREFLDTVSNLFPVGRNGMHRYNNMDHSMLTAMASVENIVSGIKSKENIWDINTEDDYHEEK